MATTSEITQSIITQARLLDPSMSLEVGTPERKIVEAVAESIAAATVDIEVLSGQLYLDELAGSRLDTFVSLFGFGRQMGTRATGVVTVSRNAPGLFDSVIPRGTQFGTRPDVNIPGLTFVAVETVVLRANETRALVRVECTTTGTVGNLPAGVIDALPASINVPGITSVVNEVPTSGGSDTELDEQLKARFQNTIFRNMAGTNDQYLALAFSHFAVTKANVIGPQSKYVEYIQSPSEPDSTNHPATPVGVDAFTTSISSVPYSKYTFSDNYFVAKGFGRNALFLKPGKDFIFNRPALNQGDTLRKQQYQVGNPAPNITLLNDKSVVLGQEISHKNNIFYFEHTYLSKASRNDWSRSIYNCVDVYVNGIQDQLASSEEFYPPTSMTFNSDTASIAYNKNYIRVLTNDHPVVGGRLQVLYHQPVNRLFSNSVRINGVEYFEAKYFVDGYGFATPAYWNELDAAYYQDESFTAGNYAIPAHYFFIKDVSSHRGTVRARDGIEWLPQNAIFGQPLPPEEGSIFNIDYSFNVAIEQLQAVMEGAKQITTDVLVHESDYRYIKMYLTIMYLPGFTEESVNLNIARSVEGFFNTQYYGTTIQLSDILQAVHSANGVDNVRWTSENQDDIARGIHKIEIVTAEGESFTTDPVYFDEDFILNDDELPALPQINGGDTIENAFVIEVKAQNTWESN